MPLTIKLSEEEARQIYLFIERQFVHHRYEAVDELFNILGGYLDECRLSSRGESAGLGPVDSAQGVPEALLPATEGAEGTTILGMKVRLDPTLRPGEWYVVSEKDWQDRAQKRVEKITAERLYQMLVEKGLL